MAIYTFDKMQYAEPGPGPWRLYVYDRDGYSRGSKWFRKGPVQYPDEEITRQAAKEQVDRALAQGLEVRIADGGDLLVFHAKGGKQLHPVNPDKFWAAVGL
jgi:hypothetical protein